jgi:2-polyprenyl-3-methyl-5-hydroxy-6-metoxy-1,4-benzoquinol methylase
MTNQSAAGDAGSTSDLTSAGYWEQEWEGRRAGGIASWTRRTRRKGRPLIRFLRHFVDEHENGSPDVLEIGCAPGGILSALHDCCPKVRLHGLDYAQEGLANTERQFARSGVPATLHCGDVREFDPGRKYDVVYSCGLVEHFTDPVPIIQHHARLCRPGGQVVLTVPNYSGRWQEALIRRLSPETLETHNTATMDPESLRQFAAAAGLANVTAGEFGMGRFYTRCSVRNWRTQSLRFAAKTWNAARRVLPLAPGWHCTVWAAGRVPGVERHAAA